MNAMLMLMVCAAAGADVTPAEMDEARQWVAAKFDGIAQARTPEAWIEVVDNHGPVQANTRGGKPMRLVGGERTRGLYCHAPSRLIVHLTEPAARFDAVVGVDSNDQTSGGRGSVVFVVRAGGKELLRSELMREGIPDVPVSVDLAGADTFTLEVEDGGDGIACDQADWTDAVITMADGSTVELGALPLRGKTKAPYTPEPFVSFNYGGRPSSEFLSDWEDERSSRPLDAARREHTLVYTDPATQLQVRCAGVEYLDFPTVEWDHPLQEQWQGGHADSLRDTGGGHALRVRRPRRIHVALEPGRYLHRRELPTAHGASRARHDETHC